MFKIRKKINGINDLQKMVKIIKNNNIILKILELTKKYVLALLLIASLYCVIRYSELPIIPFIPDFIAELFIKPEPNTTCYEVFRLLENLGLAYMASFIFYLIIDYFPNRNRSKKALEVVKGDIHSVHVCMGIIIKTVNAMADITQDINSIKLEDLEILNRFSFSNDTLYLNEYLIENGEKKIASRFTENFYSLSANTVKDIINFIRKVKNISCAIYIDFNILEILSSIETSWFLSRIFNLKPEQANQKISWGDLNKDYYLFIQSYIKLSKLSFLRIDSNHIELMDEKQKLEFKQMWNNSRL